MALVLNEEQQFLQDTAREFLKTNAPVEALRTLRDERNKTGYDSALWQQMAELGWASIILPEEYGGLDFGFLGLGVVMEEAGRTLTASPLFASAVVGASAILLGGTPSQKETLLPAIAAGETTLALALEEHNRHKPHSIATTAETTDDGYVLNGRKTFVLDGHSANQILVVARSAGDTGDSAGLSLFLVSGDAPGIQRQRTLMADSRNAANITLDNVAVGPEALVGEAGQGWSVLEPVLDRGRVAMAAEMMGIALECFERTVAYLKEREQFGALIGSFQALQHRAAFMQTQLELARSVVLQALSAVDETPEQLPLLASLAKARLNDLAQLVTNEAVQMHGGIGVTDEMEIGFFLKRARVAMQVFGDTSFHKDRYATLCGY
ncbi:acyl-CoA dehydrogenase [Halioglobus japonicus]|uniref:Acyl-CoA dehydrogenase n=1 Tax=Halioglobus japonicus TaxID=930805 RepID=A0AAP8MG70_9GAMM|nr:acyl-CoA dehydrogenase family protein [Halioglobus japonicus]AQA19722.1 acyl-CoA dehydrogenase [Halioglobus japonicus]PLW87207.1 acyl-CoA dehydrogenase [Halioglobus japonicus]GHD09661.1 acyl-CoA dehydrogenase [Halioglobus japonicus]